MHPWIIVYFFFFIKIAWRFQILVQRLFSFYASLKYVGEKELDRNISIRFQKHGMVLGARQVADLLAFSGINYL